MSAKPESSSFGPLPNLAVTPRTAALGLVGMLSRATLNTSVMATSPRLDTSAVREPGMVERYMLRCVCEHEVFRAVVGFVVIFVVDTLTGLQRSVKKLLHNYRVFVSTSMRACREAHVSTVNDLTAPPEAIERASQQPVRHVATLWRTKFWRTLTRPTIPSELHITLWTSHRVSHAVIYGYAMLTERGT